MSCFIVDHEHINVLVAAAECPRSVLALDGCADDESLDGPTVWELTSEQAAEYEGIPGVVYAFGMYQRMVQPETRTMIGQMLIDANTAAFDDAYDGYFPELYEFSPPKHTGWSPTQIIRAIHCLVYQCASWNEWEGSQAQQFCDELKITMLELLPSMSRYAALSIDPGTTPAQAA